MCHEHVLYVSVLGNYFFEHSQTAAYLPLIQRRQDKTEDHSRFLGFVLDLCTGVQGHFAARRVVHFQACAASIEIIENRKFVCCIRKKFLFVSFERWGVRRPRYALSHVLPRKAGRIQKCSVMLWAHRHYIE